MLPYYRRWLSVAFWHSWNTSDFIGSVLGLALPVIVKTYPSGQESMGDLAWQIPLAALVGLFVIRLVLAPFWMHKEDAAANAIETTNLTNTHKLEKSDLQKAMDELKDMVSRSNETSRKEKEVMKSQLDDRMASVADVKGLLHSMARKGKEFSPKNFADCKPWSALYSEALRVCLGDHAHREFNMPDHQQDTASHAKGNLCQWADWLIQKANELTSGSLTTECTQNTVAKLRSKMNSL